MLAQHGHACEKQAMSCSAYIICTTPRSGSTMLIDLLRQTGVAGRPEAYFRQLSIADFCAAFDMPAQDGWTYDAAYIAKATAWARHGGRIAGFRANWEAIGTLQSRLALCHPAARTDTERLTAAFGPTRFIYLERQDKLAQAISRTRAEQSGLWHRNADGTVREQTGEAYVPVYNADAITTYMAETTANIANWHKWFTQNAITPHQVLYEQLAHDPAKVVAGILTALGLDPAAAQGLRPGTARLANTESKSWATRYQAET